MRYFVLVIGNARSGSTLLGSILDAHPCAIVANETVGSANFWRDMDRPRILGEIAESSRRRRLSGRVSEGYRYLIPAAAKEMPRILVMGDKVWNPATLMLHGDYSLLNRLERILGVPIKIIHCIRNPFDVIATMHARSKAPVIDRAHWYFLHCSAALAVRQKWEPDRYLDFHHESTFDNPDQAIAGLCRFLELPVDKSHIQASKALLFPQLRTTRRNLAWEPAMVRMITSRMGEFDFLGRYAAEDYSSLCTNGGNSMGVPVGAVPSQLLEPSNS
jgi:hypothetical protein